MAPMSYIVESEAGVRYRRNRQDILKSNDMFANVDEFSIEDDNINIESRGRPDNSLPLQMQNMHDQSETNEPRKCGRIIKQPVRLIEEM